VLVAVLMAAFVSLGNWQLQRASEKRALLDAFDSGSAIADAVAEATADAANRYPRYTPLGARGQFDNRHQFLLDNVVQNGQVGFYVWTPLRLEGSGAAVLVNRGWFPLGAHRADLPPLDVGEQPRAVTGLLDRLPEPGLRLGGSGLSTDWPRIAVYPRIDELRAVLDYPLYDYLLLLDAAAEDGFARDWRPQLLPPQRHVGYAVQWFAFATAVLALFLILSFKRES